MTDAPILTDRLELVLLSPAFLAGRSPPDFADPLDVFADAGDVVALRLAQIAANPAVAPWLLRAIVRRDDRIAVGFIGFHDAPAGGVVEIGYEVHPEHRRRGYAFEAASAMIATAGIRVRASVAPHNAASLAMVAKLGFVHVGEQLDEVDGPELVFERR